MTIVKAELNDLPQILALQKKCYLQEAEIYDDFNIPPLIQTIDSIKEDFGKQIFLKVENEGKVIASVRGQQENDICKIGRLIVDREHQNKGLGKKLMLMIEASFKEAKKYELFTGNKSEKNLYLYQKLGYREVRRQVVNDRLQLVFLEKANV